MPFLRFLIFLSITIWLGSLIFFAFILAPTAFSPGLLPSRHLAGLIVGQSLDRLHWIVLASAVFFLIASMLYNYNSVGTARPLAARHILVFAMLLLTLISQFAITPKMHAIRTEVGVIDSIAPDDLRRIEFERLHGLSEKFEGAVLFLGLFALYSTAQSLR
jgi:uncharacterized membrane protein